MFIDRVQEVPERILDMLLALARAKGGSYPTFIETESGFAIVDTNDGRVWAIRLEELI